MSISINIVTAYSNKTVSVYEILDNEIHTIQGSNEIFSLPYDTSYIFYINPKINEIDYIGFLDILNGLFSGFLGYIWVICIGILAYILLRSIKNHV